MGYSWRWLPALFLAATTSGLFALAILGGLYGAAAWIALSTVNALLGAAVLLAVLIRIALKRRITGRRAVLLAVSLVAVWPGAWLFQLGTIPYPASVAGTKPHLEIRLPTDQPMVVYWGGDDVARNYHAATPDQRWAYDLSIPPLLTQSTKLDDYGCYGVTVLAPTAGKISFAHDGEVDEIPGQLSGNTAHPMGNAVAIETELGTHLVLAHLRPGSLLVEEGNPVEEGQPIGQCGNSGNTSEPHLHIHHQRQSPKDLPVGLAEGLPLFFRDVLGPAFPQGGVEMVDGKPRAIGDRIAPRRTTSDPRDGTSEPDAPGDSSGDRIGDALTARKLDGVDAWVITHHEPIPANALVFRTDAGLPVLVDTPWTPAATAALVGWVVRELGRKPVLAIASHYHADSAGGFAALHRLGVPTLASAETAELIRERGSDMLAELARTYGEAFVGWKMVPPKETFDPKVGLTREIGDTVFRVIHPGHAHAPDNVVVFFPESRVLFGGCMIKGGEDLGNVTVADLDDWPYALDRVKLLEPRIVVPGHGERLDPGQIERTKHLVAAHRR